MDTGLDEVFKRTVAEMKPHAKKLPQKSTERHKVTLWIKELLGVKYEKKERNAHAKLLLQQLKSSKLGPSFAEDPPAGFLSMPAASQTSSPPTDQNNDLDSLLTSVLSPSHHVLPHSRGSPSHYRHTSSQNHIGVSDNSSLTDLPQHSEHRTSSLDSQRQFNYGDLSSQAGHRTHHKTENSCSFEPQLHSTAVGAAQESTRQGALQ